MTKLELKELVSECIKEVYQQSEFVKNYNSTVNEIRVRDNKKYTVLYLKKEFIESTHRIQSLFKCAQIGIEKLKETYKEYSMICLCLNYYHTIINNFVEQIYNENIFCKDNMTILYGNEVVDKLNAQWSKEKIKIILDLISFLTNDKMATNNVKSLENIMNNIDIETRELISNM